MLSKWRKGTELSEGSDLIGVAGGDASQQERDLALDNPRANEALELLRLKVVHFSALEL